ncbi:hypothetical protein AB0E81_18440 [Streptomyces sp. NPDC033538]
MRAASSAVAQLIAPDAAPSELFTPATTAAEPPVLRRGLVFVARE